MRRVIYGIVIFVTAGVGAFFAAGYGLDDRSAGRVRWHLEVIHDQLTGLKEQLIQYKQAHGRYPTNDEGLAALDNFQSRFKITCFRLKGRALDGVGDLGGADHDRMLWILWKDSIDYFRGEHHRLPRSADDLRKGMFDSLIRQPPPEYAEEYEPVEMEIAIGKGDNLLFLGPAGVLSPWFLPYMYENRRGLDAAVFADSLVNKDTKGQYSLRVDDGVYLYCIGAEAFAAELPALWWIRNLPRLGGVALLSVAAVFAVLVIRAEYKRLAVAALLGATALGVAGAMGSHITCYVMAPLFSHREPQMVERQKELLDKYRARGVISEATYRRIVEAVEKGPATQPATKPAETN